MARSGECVGMNIHRAVWRFGFSFGSDAAFAYKVNVPRGTGPFFWYLTDRKTGEIIEEFEGMAFQMPDHFRIVINDECPSAP